MRSLKRVQPTSLIPLFLSYKRNQQMRTFNAKVFFLACSCNALSQAQTKSSIGALRHIANVLPAVSALNHDLRNQRNQCSSSQINLNNISSSLGPPRLEKYHCPWKRKMHLPILIKRKSPIQYLNFNVLFTNNSILTNYLIGVYH